MTLLESLQAEIATAETDLAAKKATLAGLETTAGSWLSNLMGSMVIQGAVHCPGRVVLESHSEKLTVLTPGACRATR